MRNDDHNRLVPRTEEDGMTPPSTPLNSHQRTNVHALLVKLPALRRTARGTLPGCPESPGVSIHGV